MYNIYLYTKLFSQGDYYSLKKWPRSSSILKPNVIHISDQMCTL